MAHAFSKYHCKGVWLRSHGASRIPDLNAASAHGIGNYVLYGKVKYLYISEKESKSHGQPPVGKDNIENERQIRNPNIEIRKGYKDADEKL